MAKPDPRIYSLMLERIRRPAADCLFIDDSRGNITVAEELGFKTILFESPEKLRRELHTMGLLERKP